MTAVSHAQAPVALDALGPQPGTRVPEFSATDQAGRVHTLKSLLGPKGAMLVFSRSADW
jgi:peroxiredoxin